MPDTHTHREAMAIHTLSSTVAELMRISADGIGFDLLRNDIPDLEAAYFRLSLLLSALQAEKAA